MIFVEITKLLSFSSATIFKKRMPFAAFACLRKAFTLLELVVYFLLNRGTTSSQTKQIDAKLLR